MYFEFKLVFICFGVVALFQIITIVFLIILLKKVSKGRAMYTGPQNYPQTGVREPETRRSSVAFCTNCGTQFDAALKVCPKCGRAR